MKKQHGSCLGLSVLVVLFYTYRMMTLEGSFDTHATQIAWLWVETTVLSIALVIIAFVLLSFFSDKNSDPDELLIIDERDNLIEAKANQGAYWVFHVFILLILVLCRGVFSGFMFFPSLPPIDVLIHGLVFAGLLAEIISRSLQIRRYHQAD